MDSVQGSSAAYQSLELVWLEMRHLLDVLIWALVVGLAGAAGCWCCGYAVRAAWLKSGPPARRPRPDATPPDDAPPPDEVALEAERGIRELEAYLASVGDHRPGSTWRDGGQDAPGADAA